MLEGVLNTPVFRLLLIVFCVIIANIWWDIWNSYMARGLLLNDPEKNCIDNISSKSQKRHRLAAFILVNTIQHPRTLKYSIYHSNKRGPLPFFHSDTNPVLVYVLFHSVDKIHVLVVTVELIWLLFLNFLSTLYQHQMNLLGWQDSEEAL